MKKIRKEDTYSYREEKIDGENCYFVLFTDSNGKVVEESVNKDTFFMLKELYKIEISQAISIERYITYYFADENDCDISLSNLSPTPSTENIVLNSELNNVIYNAIESLTDTQKRRFLMHFEEGISMQEIARIEGCHYYATNKSVNAAKKNIEKKIKNFFSEGD